MRPLNCLAHLVSLTNLIFFSRVIYIQTYSCCFNNLICSFTLHKKTLLQFLEQHTWLLHLPFQKLLLSWPVMLSLTHIGLVYRSLFRSNPDIPWNSHSDWFYHLYRFHLCHGTSMCHLLQQLVSVCIKLCPVWRESAVLYLSSAY